MKIEITHTQMNLMLAAVEFGFRACEKGKNLEAALLGVMDLYAVEPPRPTHSIPREAGPVHL